MILLHFWLPLENKNISTGELPPECVVESPLLGDQKESLIGALLIDREFQFYPISLQNLMWILFFGGLGELTKRLRSAKNDRAECDRGLLPEDDETVLTAAQLPEIYRTLTARPAVSFLPRMAKRVILQFQSSRAVDQANSLLNSSAELFLHELDLRYNFLRYVMWLIPTLGFIGTVFGIAYALAYAGGEGVPECVNFVSQLTNKMAVAFNTTLLALIQASILVFFFHAVQGEEESVLNTCVQYCLDNLVNRLYKN